MNTLDIFAQIGVFVFGVGSVLLASLKSKWGFAAGLLSQPFWFYTAIYHNQWGVVAASCLYTIVWSIGVYNWFFKKEALKKEI